MVATSLIEVRKEGRGWCGGSEGEGGDMSFKCVEERIEFVEEF